MSTSVVFGSLEQRWQSLARYFGADDVLAGKWWDVIIGRYGEPTRSYHTLRHIASMFQEMEDCGVTLKQDHLVSLAIFFHDIVYDPHSDDNEERSVDMLQEFATAASMKADDTETVISWIQLTKSHGQNTVGDTDPDGALFLDLDLSILGHNQTDYDAYSTQIRNEYSHVPDEEYRLKRCQVLGRFLQCDRVYMTDAFRTKYEDTARANIAAEISSLTLV